VEARRHIALSLMALEWDTYCESTRFQYYGPAF
jgi:hypothetical protein